MSNYKYMVLVRTNPAIKQFTLWGKHKTKKDAEKHLKASEEKNPNFEFKLVSEDEVGEIKETDTEGTEK